MGQKEWLLEMSLRKLFPDLTDNNHALTSPRTINYSCVAWAAQIRNVGGNRVYSGLSKHRKTSTASCGVLPVASISVTETKAAPVAANSESASM